MPHSFRRPRLPRHYYVWSEPPDSAGDEVLNFVSERRRIKLKGHSFREFEQRVIPLLDGRHTTEEIEQEVADVFARLDLAAGLDLLARQSLIEDAADDTLPGDLRATLAPQLAFFHELDENPVRLQERLLQSTVTVFGLAGAGAGIVEALAAARVGAIRCVDDQPVTAADAYLSPAFRLGDVGALRAEVVARHVRERAPDVRLSLHTGTTAAEDEIVPLIAGSQLVACSLDAGQSSLVYKLNRACLGAGIRSTFCALAGAEAVIGPTVVPFETACYLCYRMRAVACAGNPEDGFAFEQFLDRRKRDDSGRRANTVFGAGVAAHALALDMVKTLAGLQAATAGRIVVFDLLTSRTEHHVVLRKPACPACGHADAAVAHPDGGS